MEKHAIVVDGEDDHSHIKFRNYFKESIIKGTGKITFNTKTTDAFRRVLQPGAKIKVGDAVYVIAASDEK